MTTETKVGSALTAAEWAEVRCECTELSGEYLVFDGSYVVPDGQFDRRGLAAACLYGQPGGFTREMVEAVEWLIGVAEDSAAEHGADARGHPMVALAQEMTANVEALTVKP